MAARFWVGNDGTWDAADTTHWSASTGGAGGASVPGTADAVTIDAASGTGVITVNATITVQSITCGAMTMTLDFATNNNNVTLSTATGFSGTGTATRTINLGNGTWTLTATGTLWNMATVTGLTFAANSSTIILQLTNATARTFAGGGLTYNNVTFDTNTSKGAVSITGSNTFGTFTANPGNHVAVSASTTQTISTDLLVTGTSSNPVFFTNSGIAGASGTWSKTSGTVTMTWAALHSVTFSGGATFVANDSLQGITVSGITVNPPVVGGGARVIGG